jgi:mannosyltransferase OCH1-like enzyme
MLFSFLEQTYRNRIFFPTGIIRFIKYTINEIYSYRYHVINEKCCAIVVADIISGENWL